MKKLYFIISFLSICSHAQQYKKVDFEKANASIKFDLSEQKVLGTVEYQFLVKELVDTIQIDAKDMLFSEVTVNNKKVGYKSDIRGLKLYEGFTNGKNTVKIKYSAIPKQSLYFTGAGNDLQIWTQGQGKLTSYWLPSFDDYNEKVIFNLDVSFDNDFSILSNGTFLKKQQNASSTTWFYEMKKPMPSYLVMLAVGKWYIHKEKSDSGISLESYIQHKDKDKIPVTYKDNKRIFDYLEKEIGYAYPWEVYRNIPIDDFLYSGMENTTSTIFNQDFVVDEIGFNDRKYINVNAHEMAHQWFGNVVTAQSGEHHWLQEGFATYYALKAERELFGEDYLYYELYEMAEKLIQESRNHSNTKIISKGATTLTYYQKGAWALFALEQTIGKDTFSKAVKNYLHKYAFQNVNTNQFLDEISSISNFDRNDFEEKWLNNNSFPVEDVMNLLKKSNSIREYLEIVDLQNKPFSNKKDQLYHQLKTTKYLPVQKEIIYQLHEVPYNEAASFYTYIMESNILELRQALSQIIQEIPEAFYTDYQKLLDDKSYITRELVLKNLWYQKPDQREELLMKSSNWIGFNDKNLRITWLMLALGTETIPNNLKKDYYIELQNYTTSKYNSNTRTNAIQAMWFLNKYDSNVLPQLINALVHHNYRFQQFAQKGIKDLMQQKEFEDYFKKQLPYLPNNEKKALQRLMH